MTNEELLSEVLNLKICIDDTHPYIQSNMLVYDVLDNDEINTNNINIYELAHKCKEWLLDNGYYIKISPFKVELFEKDTNCFMRDFYSPIQSKSIPYDIKREIQACQWILDNKETK